MMNIDTATLALIAAHRFTEGFASLRALNPRATTDALNDCLGRAIDMLDLNCPI